VIDAEEHLVADEERRRAKSTSGNGFVGRRAEFGLYVVVARTCK
jgi:hypothetical protein